VAKCNDVACAGGDEIISTIDSTGDTGLYTAIIIGQDGLPVISYLDFTEFVLKVAKCNDAACAGGDETLSVVDPRVALGWFTSMTIGPGGFPVISYYDITRADLKVAACNDAACAGGDETVTAVDHADDAGWDTSIALGTDGFPVISYYQETGGDLKVAKCNDAACTGGDEIITIIDSAGDVGQYTSLAIGADGFPVISYYDVTDGDLKLAKCNDASCAGGDELITTLDSDGDVGRHSSITVGPGGFPVISYYDATNTALKIARCNDTACADGDELIVTLDQGDRGTYCSVTMGSDGFPVISYRDDGAGNLRIFKAANPFMRDYWTRR
jgi:hypothetical protein